MVEPIYIWVYKNTNIIINLISFFSHVCYSYIHNCIAKVMVRLLLSVLILNTQ